MLKSAASQVIGDNGAYGQLALKLAPEALSPDQDSINVPTRSRLRTKLVEAPARGAHGITGHPALFHAVVEPKHGPEFTPVLLLTRF